MANNFTINIDTAQMRTTANTINELNKKLTTKLFDIREVVIKMNQDWQSSAGDAVINKMKGLETRFNEYFNIIQDYKTFLERTAASYDSTEHTLKENAEAKFI